MGDMRVARCEPAQYFNQSEVHYSIKILAWRDIRDNVVRDWPGKGLQPDAIHPDY
jgi:hypothetical protein